MQLASTVGALWRPGSRRRRRGRLHRGWLLSLAAAGLALTLVGVALLRPRPEAIWPAPDRRGEPAAATPAGDDEGGAAVPPGSGAEASSGPGDAGGSEPAPAPSQQVPSRPALPAGAASLPPPEEGRRAVPPVVSQPRVLAERQVRPNLRPAPADLEELARSGPPGPGIRADDPEQAQARGGDPYLSLVVPGGLSPRAGEVFPVQVQRTGPSAESGALEIRFDEQALDCLAVEPAGPVELGEVDRSQPGVIRTRLRHLPAGETADLVTLRFVLQARPPAEVRVFAMMSAVLDRDLRERPPPAPAELHLQPDR